MGVRAGEVGRWGRGRVEETFPERRNIIEAWRQSISVIKWILQVIIFWSFIYVYGGRNGEKWMGFVAQVTEAS